MKITIVGGGGTLGSCTAYTLALKGLADELVLLDIKRGRTCSLGQAGNEQNHRIGSVSG